MSFGENLKFIRKKRNITQKQLAQLLDVSRQSVSKWEADKSYPDSEKLVLIAKELDVSSDYLLLNRTNKDKSIVSDSMAENKKVTLSNSSAYSAIIVPNGKIAITSFNNNSIVQCLSVKISKILSPKKYNSPYLLLGVDKITLLGEHTVILAWYEKLEDIQKEIIDISKAIENKKLTYSLKYFSDVDFKGMFGEANKE